MKKLFTLIIAAGILAACSSDDDKGKDNSIRLTVDFENVPANILAVDSYGRNFYDGYEGEQYTAYTDTKSGLHFSINKAEDGTFNYWNGGTVFSTLNEDLTINDYQNQCTVNYVDSSTGKGGNKGSRVFGVINGPAVISFVNSEEHLIDHLWAMNTAYASLAMKDGNQYARALSYEKQDYFYTTITGYSAAGTKTGSVDFYLGDFRTDKSPGIIDRWTKVDLSKLGKVNRIEFSFDGSDTGEYGLNTPKYLCIDDIAVVKEDGK